MKKLNCYPNLISVIFLLMVVLTIFLAFISFVFFKEPEGGIYWIIYTLLVIFSFSFSVWGFFYHSQYIIIKENKLILKTLFNTIKVLDLTDCYYEITNLSTYFGRRYINEKWICIYSINEKQKFKYGLANSKKYMRIQLIYSKRNLEFINSVIKSK